MTTIRATGPNWENICQFLLIYDHTIQLCILITSLILPALPPLRFFLKLEYLVRLLKKLVKAVCKCLKPYWSGILLTTG